MLILILSITVVLLLFLIHASYSMRSGIHIKALCRNGNKGRVVALTFDDGPDKEQTPKVLDALKTHNVKACFFCMGRKIKGNEALLLRMKEEGHLIGNHSFNHFFSFPLYSSLRMKEELRDCEQAIEEVTKNKTRLFRPPFGVTNPVVAKAVKAMDYITIGWSIRSLDTCMSENAALRRIKRRLKPGAVILLHDPLPLSDSLLRKVLELIKENHYTIERVDKLFDISKITK